MLYLVFSMIWSIERRYLNSQKFKNEDGNWTTWKVVEIITTADNIEYELQEHPRSDGGSIFCNNGDGMRKKRISDRRRAFKKRGVLRVDTSRPLVSPEERRMIPALLTPDLDGVVDTSVADPQAAVGGDVGTFERATSQVEPSPSGHPSVSGISQPVDSGNAGGVDPAIRKAAAELRAPYGSGESDDDDDEFESEDDD